MHRKRIFLITILIILLLIVIDYIILVNAKSATSPNSPVEYFDAYYGLNYYESNQFTRLSYETILESNIINEKDKEVLRKYCEKEIKARKIKDFVRFRKNDNYDVYLYVCFGEKDSSDIFYIYNIYSVYYSLLLKDKRNAEFVFQSNLTYSFSKIIDKYNDEYGISISQEMLNNENLRILFRNNGENKYEEYYALYFDNTTYYIYN